MREVENLEQELELKDGATTSEQQGEEEKKRKSEP
jgi:hypothetical protein